MGRSRGGYWWIRKAKNALQSFQTFAKESHAGDEDDRAADDGEEDAPGD